MGSLGGAGFSQTLFKISESGKSPIGSPRGKEKWKLAFLAVMWVLWKKSNARCFEGEEKIVNSV